MSGTESYDLSSGKRPDEPQGIVLNIQEEKPMSAVLLESTLELEGKGGDDKNDIASRFGAINRYLISKSKVKIDAKSAFYHLLSVMINSGMPMVKALKSLAKQTEKSPRLQIIISEVAAYIEGGSSLSESLSGYPDVFSEQEVGMIQSGEASGQLGKVLARLATDTEKAYRIKGKVKSAMTYPTVIFLLLIAVIVVMMVWVIPQLTQLFASSGQELPLITRIVVGTSDFMINQKFALVGGVLLFALTVSIFKRTTPGQYFFDRLVISLPIFGKLVKMSLLSRFARTLSNLLESRVSIVKAMEINANSIGNEVYRKRLLLSVDDIKQGIPLAESLTESTLFPPMLVNMLEVGEQTAQMDTIAAKVAEFYENEVDTAVEGISKVIEPVILIVIGVVVGGVVAAIMLPIMKLSNIAGAV